MSRRGPRCPGEHPDVQERTWVSRRGPRCPRGHLAVQERTKVPRREPRCPGGDPGIQEGLSALGTFWGGGGPPARRGAAGARHWGAGGHGDGLDPLGEGDGRQELDQHDVVVLGAGVVVGVRHQLLHHLPLLAPFPREEVVLAQADGGDPAAPKGHTWDGWRGGQDTGDTATCVGLGDHGVAVDLVGQRLQHG